MQAGELTHSHAPRPGSVRPTRSDPSAERTTRNSSSAGRRVRHPTQVRTGPGVRSPPDPRRPARRRPRRKIGRAHLWTPVNNADLGSRILLGTTNTTDTKRDNKHDIIV